MLKLYYCVASTTDHDWVEIIVAKDLDSATEQFNKMVEESGSWYAGVNVDELNFDDYEVTIMKK